LIDIVIGLFNPSLQKFILFFTRDRFEQSSEQTLLQFFYSHFHSQMHIYQNKVMAQTFILHMNGTKPQSVLCKQTLAKYQISEISKNQRTCI
jgi:hypothetical protein